jgi:uncharacterized protein YyaL (SSP411 family)
VKEIFYVSMMYDVLAQGGGYYSFRGERINDEKGKENALAVIRYDLDLQKNLKEEVFNLALPHLKDSL